MSLRVYSDEKNACQYDANCIWIFNIHVTVLGIQLWLSTFFACSRLCAPAPGKGLMLEALILYRFHLNLRYHCVLQMPLLSRHQKKWHGQSVGTCIAKFSLRDEQSSLPYSSHPPPTRAMLLVDTVTCWTAVAHLETECQHARLLGTQTVRWGHLNGPFERCCILGINVWWRIIRASEQVDERKPCSGRSMLG